MENRIFFNLSGQLFGNMVKDSKLSLDSWLNFCLKNNIKKISSLNLKEVYVCCFDNFDIYNFELSLFEIKNGDYAKVKENMQNLVDFCEGFIFALGCLNNKLNKEEEVVVANLYQIINAYNKLYADQFIPSGLDGNMADFLEIKEFVKLNVLSLILEY